MAEKGNTQQLQRIGALVPAEQITTTTYSPDMLLNRDMVLESLSWNSGQFGDFVTLNCYRTDTQERIVVNTGMKTICDQCQHLTQEMLPAAFRFTPWGKQIKMV